jgi:hypothetical protein
VVTHNYDRFDSKIKNQYHFDRGELSVQQQTTRTKITYPPNADNHENPQNPFLAHDQAVKATEGTYIS